MKGLWLRPPGGLDALQLEEMPDPGLPGPGEIRVRLHASSLNYHDLLVVTGGMATATPMGEGRIPLSDGAGVVEAAGEGVTEIAEGDVVIACFFPQWQDGGPMVASFSGSPGDGIDGYAREIVVAPATWFTRAPKGYNYAEAATLGGAGLTAWRALVVEGGLKPLNRAQIDDFALPLASHCRQDRVGHAENAEDVYVEQRLSLGHRGLPPRHQADPCQHY